MSGVRLQVVWARYKVTGCRFHVSGSRLQVSGCMVPGFNFLLLTKKFMIFLENVDGFPTDFHVFFELSSAALRIHSVSAPCQLEC